ncbi:MAG: DUF4380 domain-containing protein [Candidatus Brocadiaceae bacterium]|nr:DUF4380 domain-containing protein [Candidatus Brocadiaceae bacterium]
MKMPLATAGLLPLVVLCLAMAGGCASGSGGTHAPGAVRVNRVPYRGWEDALLMTNGDAVVVIVPQVARIMEYSTAGGENLLWIKDELAPEVSGSPGTQGHTRQWENFGGYKLWPAPEKVWRNPPPWELDRGACRVEVSRDGVVTMIGLPCPDFGLRFDRQFTLAPAGSRLEVKQTAVNISDKPITASIWDVTQVRHDVDAFVPMGPGARYRMVDREPFRQQWTFVDGMMVLNTSGADGKAFFSGPPGWLGCRRGEEVYLKVFEIDPTLPPDPETPREVYTCKDYVELEVVGPAVELQPGESTTLTEYWYLLPVPEPVNTNEDLVRVARELAEAVSDRRGSPR